MDHYHHYQCFVRELITNPDLKLQTYCEWEEILWRRLYDWMRRNHISLRQLYSTYGRKQTDSDEAFVGKEGLQFTELKFIRETGNAVSSSTVGGVRIVLPSGVVVELEGCSAPVLRMLVAQCMGKELRDVRS